MNIIKQSKNYKKYILNNLRSDFMKIVCVDNYDRELYNDVLVCENISKVYNKR